MPRTGSLTDLGTEHHRGEEREVMGRLDSKVTFNPGATRSCGCSHAIRQAQVGANIIAVDLAGQIDNVPHPRRPVRPPTPTAT
jgi:hypothetical protein